MTNNIQEHIEVLNSFYEKDFAALQNIAIDIARRLSEGACIFIFGNGGSSAEAQHFSAELLGRFEREGRPPARAYCLCSDTATLTALANDFGYDTVFSRQVQGLARPGDILFGISTSGTSRNVLNAFEVGRKIGTFNCLLTGGGNVFCDLENLDEVIKIPSFKTAIIQEVHLVVIHQICRVFDAGLKNAI